MENTKKDGLLYFDYTFFDQNRHSLRSNVSGTNAAGCRRADGGAAVSNTE